MNKSSPNLECQGPLQARQILLEEFEQGTVGPVDASISYAVEKSANLQIAVDIFATSSRGAICSNCYALAYHVDCGMSACDEDIHQFERGVLGLLRIPGIKSKVAFPADDERFEHFVWMRPKEMLERSPTTCPCSVVYHR